MNNPNLITLIELRARLSGILLFGAAGAVGRGT